MADDTSDSVETEQLDTTPMSQKEVNQVLDTFNVIGKAAKQSDRWWFLALLCIGIFAVGWLYQDMRAQNAILTTKVDTMHTQLEEFLKTTLLTTVAAQNRNSEALERNTAALQRVEVTFTRNNN